jgi:hypothetical protein
VAAIPRFEHNGFKPDQSIAPSSWNSGRMGHMLKVETYCEPVGFRSGRSRELPVGNRRPSHASVAGVDAGSNAELLAMLLVMMHLRCSANAPGRTQQLVLLFPRLLAVPLACQSFLDTPLLSGLQVVGVTLDFLDDVLLLHLPLEPAERILEGFAFLYANFCQRDYTSQPANWLFSEYRQTRFSSIKTKFMS